MNIQRFSSYRSSFKSLWKTLQQNAQSAMQLLPFSKVYRPLLITGFFLPAELFVRVLCACLHAYFAKLTTPKMQFFVVALLSRHPITAETLRSWTNRRLEK